MCMGESVQGVSALVAHSGMDITEAEDALAEAN